MKKKISQISLILIMVIGFSAVLMPNAYASLAGINCVSSVNEGESFSVSLIYPSGYEITAAQADVTVTYSDNSTQTDKIVYTVDKDLNLTVDTPAKFTAKVAGTAKISATNILMAKSDGTVVENNGTKTATLTVVAKQTNAGSSNTGTSNSGSSSNGGSTGSSSSTGSTGSSTPSTPTTTPSTPTTTPSTPTTTTPKFTDVNETVYTTTRCNLRESYSTSSNRVATVDAGTKLTRKGVGDNSWSKCEYNGKTVYVSSQYLTITAPDGATEEPKEDEKEPENVTFKDTHENLYAKQNCNLRASWSTDSEKVGYLNKGQAVERTGYADNGWSRILYNGKTVYVASRLLVVEKPEEDEAENTVTNEVVNEVAIDSTIINESIISEEEMLNIIKEEVGVLPEVGTNVANIAYVIVTAMAICGLAAGIIYIKKIK